ncbi:unnamed protein product [Bemisia tabaci]|uniref:Sulfatase N-terminal domain-containing protein n=2 Tax=Bemisia tabaci TaxID=7038 RepID=A0A9P0A2Y3_BEMTA|nr:unnamed protein product [Bemisia tabaci]
MPSVVHLLFLLLFSMISINSKCSQIRNVLLIVADDAGFEMRVYNNSAISTPNLDTFASQSVTFTKAFASVSSCSPSRSALLTGRINHENGMYGLHNGVHHFNSFDKIKSLPHYLSKHHVRTGIIGKKHVGPKSVYRFDYEETEENHSILQVGRNITLIKELVRGFLHHNSSQPFFLYVAFHDPHRCGHTHPQYGIFCERFGDGQGSNGVIPDWKPKFYDPNLVQVPYYVQDTPAARQEIAYQYTTISRLDQGVGLVLQELESAALLDNTVIIYTSDNGPPFPAGRTNLYDSGISVPLIIKIPDGFTEHHRTNGKQTDFLVSHLHLAPFILEWFGVSRSKLKSEYPNHLSLMSYFKGEMQENKDIFASHSLHEVTMNYPMRAIRTNKFKLIHNLNYKAPFPIDQDFYLSLSFQDILNRTINNLPLPWSRSLKSYYYRPEWELFDLSTDKKEVKNIAYNNTFSEVFSDLKKRLWRFQNKSNDPWICGLGAVFENSGTFKQKPRCLPLYNGL